MTMKFHWEKSGVTGKRMKFSLSDVAVFSVTLCRISLWAHFYVLCNLVFFSQNILKAKKR